MLEVDARTITVNLQDYKLACTLFKRNLVKTIYANNTVYTNNHNVNGENKCLIANGQLKNYEVIKEGNHFLMTDECNAFIEKQGAQINATITQNYIILIMLDTPSTLFVIDRKSKAVIESAKYLQ